MEYFTVTNTDLFMTEVSELYANAGTPLTRQVGQMIVGLVGAGKRYDVQNVIPGLHAQAGAVNSVLTRYPGVLMDVITGTNNK
ncbi:hypothetical protein ACLEJW_10005 [Pseudomonas sp. SMSB3]|uniref:hypothetical protein n=1 Tax=Pseudomonas sp. SMSB3 TaxID=3390196 RepID=UPI003F858C9B